MNVKLSGKNFLFLNVFNISSFFMNYYIFICVFTINLLYFENLYDTNITRRCEVPQATETIYLSNSLFIQYLIPI